MISSPRLLWSILALFAVSVAAVALAVKDLDPIIAAQLWAAFGSVFAVFVALMLALQSSTSSKVDADKRSAAAAILVSTNLYALRAALDVIAENSAMVKADPIGYAQWLSGVSRHLKILPPVIEDRYLGVLVDLPTADLFCLVMAGNWLQRFQQRYAFGDAVTIAQVIQSFDSMIDEIVRGREAIADAANRMHALSLIPGPAPWETKQPSWVAPSIA